jgi:hypothetical protein
MGRDRGELRKRFGARMKNASWQPAAQRSGDRSASAERAVHAAELESIRKMAYADAFALDLAMDSPDHVLPQLHNVAVGHAGNVVGHGARQALGGNLRLVVFGHQPGRPSGGEELDHHSSRARAPAPGREL